MSTESTKAFALVLVAALLPGALRGQSAGVTIAAMPDQCSHAKSVQLWARTFFPRQPPPGRSESYGVRTNLKDDGAPITSHVTFVDGQSTDGTCQWTFADVAAGDYVALLYRPDGSGGTREFSVQPGSSVTIALPAPTVTLSGRVLRRGVPIPGVTVRVISLPFWRPAITTFTDADGHYQVLLDRPGLHEVHAELIGAFTRAEAVLHEGQNQLDLLEPTQASPPPAPRRVTDEGTD